MSTSSHPTRSERTALIVASHPPGSGSGSGLRGRVTVEALRSRFDVVNIVSFSTRDEEALADPATLLIPRPGEIGLLARVAAIRYGGAYYAPERMRGRDALRTLLDEERIRPAYDLLWVNQSLLARAALGMVTAHHCVLDIDNIAGADRRRSAADPTASQARRSFRRISAAVLAHEERARCNRFDRVTLPSELERERLGDVTTPVTILPNTIEAGPRVRPGAAPPRLLFVGSLDYEPNIDAVRILTRAILPAVRTQVGAAELTVAGRNPTAEVTALCAGADAELAANAPTLEPLYANARVVVAPLRLGGGTRFKIIEAMARGAAVVATSTAAEGLLVAPGRDIAVADDPTEFAANCVRLLCDPTAAEALGAAARDTWARHYRPDVAQAVIFSLLDELF